MNIDAISAKAQIRIRKSPAEVFSAFAEAELMSKFWFARNDDGLKVGETVSWFIRLGEEAVSFPVLVTELNPPHTIVIEWEGPDGVSTQVTWSFQESSSGDTLLMIEETGFTGSPEAIMASVLDSTGGFNQVIIAAKALLEHGVALNVVADHI